MPTIPGVGMGARWRYGRVTFECFAPVSALTRAVRSGRHRDPPSSLSYDMWATTRAGRTASSRLIPSAPESCSACSACPGDPTDALAAVEPRQPPVRGRGVVRRVEFKLVCLAMNLRRMGSLRTN